MPWHPLEIALLWLPFLRVCFWGLRRRRDEVRGLGFPRWLWQELSMGL
jgi:hypothetical protein